MDKLTLIGEKMPINYAIKFKKFDVEASLDGYDDVVTTVYLTMKGEDTSRTMIVKEDNGDVVVPLVVQKTLSVRLGPPRPGFIPRANVTTQNLRGWINSSTVLQEDGSSVPFVPWAKSVIASNMDKLANPPSYVEKADPSQSEYESI